MRGAIGARSTDAGGIVLSRFEAGPKSTRSKPRAWRYYSTGQGKDAGRKVLKIRNMAYEMVGKKLIHRLTEQGQAGIVAAVPVEHNDAGPNACSLCSLSLTLESHG